MDQVHAIRHKVLVEGLSIRKTAKDLGVSRNTVRKYLKQSEFRHTTSSGKVSPIEYEKRYYLSQHTV